MSNVGWKNLQRIKQRFNSLPSSVREVADDELEKQVEQLVAALKRAAPTSDLELRPGQLRDSIEASRNGQRLISFRVIAWARDEKGRLYGRYVEFGHTAADGKWVPAEPFWFSTYRAWKKGMLAAIRKRVRDRLKAEFPSP